MPEITGVSHVDLSVSSLDRSEEWYNRLLGTVRVLDGTNEERGFSFRYLLEPKSRTILGLVQHGNRESAEFTPLRNGLDHLSFNVPSQGELEAWRDRLDRLGVTHGGIDEQPVGANLSFTDPDGIALEFYLLKAALPAAG